MTAVPCLIPIFPDIPMKVKVDKEADIILADIPILKEHQRYVKIREG